VRSKLIPWAALVGYAALIFALSSIPAKSMPEGRFWDFDKVIHAGEYAVLAALLWWALGRSFQLPVMVRASVAAGSAALYGVSDEFHQSFVPGRAASGFDVLADAGGAVVAVLLLWWLQRVRMRS